MCGKSARRFQVIGGVDKPCGLKCYVHFGFPSTCRAKEGLRAQLSLASTETTKRGKQIDFIGNDEAR